MTMLIKIEYSVPSPRILYFLNFKTCKKDSFEIISPHCAYVAHVLKHIHHKRHKLFVLYDKSPKYIKTLPNQSPFFFTLAKFSKTIFFMHLGPK